MSLLVGESAHSEDLYLYAINTSEIYKQRRVLELELKELFDKNTSDCSKFGYYELRELQSILDRLVSFFREAGERYKREMPDVFSVGHTFTTLDFYICAVQHLQHLMVEYDCNGLE